MWVNRKDHERLVEEKAELKQALADATKEKVQLGLRVNFLETSFDWLRSTYNKLEAERSALLQVVTGKPVPSLELEYKSEKPTTPEASFNFAMFEDVGDEDAARLGILGTPEA